MRLFALPVALTLLLEAATPAVAWDHFDRSHPSRRTLYSFRWMKPFLDLSDGGNGQSDKDIDRDIPGGFHVACQEQRSFSALQYTVAELNKPYPDGLAPWAEMLDIVLNHRVYPGGWEGDELLDEEKTVLLMEYKDVPLSVRYFVEQEAVDAYTAKRWLFGVYDKPKPKKGGAAWSDGGSDSGSGSGSGGGGPATPTVEKYGDESSYVVEPPVPIEEKVMIFAPGALYDILPLWVADDSPCKKHFRDLEKYVPIAAHNKVIAWPTIHTEPDLENGKREVEIGVRASLVYETVEGRRYREAWENIHLQASRNERRLQRLEREEGKGRYRLHGSEHDEL